mmetsp:Transcript_11290/g.21542  ORF Transcript_11290/g.21542 Transcript_11290/m.21542 type:complete len:335 (+) Transcript_11290:143-1147(+)
MGKDAASILGGRAEERKIRNTITSRAAAGYDSDDDEAIWQEEIITWENVENPFYRKLASFLVLLKCLPEDRADATFVVVSLSILQWLSLLADISAACVAIVTFNGVTYCCGEAILNFGSLNMPWEHMIRVLTYLYLVLILVELYPVVKKGFPFNIANPLMGFIVTLAMFFDDSKTEALIMWCIETFAVLCEYGIYCFKSYQRNWLNKEVERLAILTIPKEKRSRRRNSNESVEATEIEQLKYRQDYFRLKLEQKFMEKTFWYLRFACYLNILLVSAVLVLIIFISRAGGLCINGGRVPNLFDPDQIARCPACSDEDGFCEVCAEGVRMCYYPYG